MDPVTLVFVATGAAASAVPPVLRALVTLLSSNEGIARFVARFGIDLQELPVHEPQGETFEDRIRRLASALESSAATITEIQGEIDRRQPLVVQLQEDANRYEQLSQLKRAEAEAVAQLVEGKLRQGERRSLWAGFVTVIRHMGHITTRCVGCVQGARGIRHSDLTLDVAHVAYVAAPAASIGNGWRYDQRLVPCAACGVGTSNLAPSGSPLHLACTAQDHDRRPRL